MKAGRRIYSYYLAIVFPLLTALIVYFVYRNSFIADALFTEESAVAVSYFVMIAGGIAGVLSALTGIYQSMRIEKIFIVILRILVLFPFLLISCVFLYGFMILKGLL